MSSHYHAGQYNDAFRPKYLRNWSFGVNEYPGRLAQFSCPCKTKPTCFIACDNGHLFPHIPRNGSSSPWGDYRTSIWEERKQCCCLHRAKNPGLYPNPSKKVVLPKFFKNNENKRNDTLETIPETQEDALISKSSICPKNDAFINYLRKINLPIICMIGLPTHKIDGIRRAFCKKFAEENNFVYISLDEMMGKWKERVENTGQISVVEPIIKDAKLTEFLDKEKTKLSTQDSKDPSILTGEECEKGESGEEKEKFHAPKLSILSNLEKINTAYVLELLKFAMIENLPTNGFIIENFPFDTKDLDSFESLFYPITIGVYFTESYSTNSGKFIKVFGPLKRDTVYPASYSRLKYFSYSKGDKLCDEFGDKIIKITNAEAVNVKILQLLNTLMLNNLAKHETYSLTNGTKPIKSRSGGSREIWTRNELSSSEFSSANNNFYNNKCTEPIKKRSIVHLRKNLNGRALSSNEEEIKKSIIYTTSCDTSPDRMTPGTDGRVKKLRSKFTKFNLGCSEAESNKDYLRLDSKFRNFFNKGQSQLNHESENVEEMGDVRRVENSLFFKREPTDDYDNDNFESISGEENEEKRGFSPDEHVDYLMTVARISIQSSSNDEGGDRNRSSWSRGRSRVKD